MKKTILYTVSCAVWMIASVLLAIAMVGVWNPSLYEISVIALGGFSMACGLNVIAQSSKS